MQWLLSYKIGWGTSYIGPVWAGSLPGVGAGNFGDVEGNAKVWVGWQCRLFGAT